MLLSLLEQNNTRPTTVLAVRTEGGRASRDAFIKRQLQPLLERDTTTFSEFLRNIDSASRNLTSFGVYSDVVFSLESVDERFSFGDGRSLTVQPVLTLREAKRFTAKTGTDVGNGEGSGYVSCQFKHMFGGAESLLLDASVGTRTKSSYLANLGSPLFNSPLWRSELLAFATSREVPYANQIQSMQGVGAKLKYLGDVHKVELSVEQMVRTISANPGASRTVKFACGDDLKRSATAIYTYDTRDVGVMPTSGHMVKLTGEYISSDNLLRAQAEYSSGKRFRWAIINWGGRAGALSRNDTSGVHLMDRFYLGGANDVRGFALYGMGPRDEGDAIGGAMYSCMGLSLFTAVPGLKNGLDNNLKWHHFVNSGALIPTTNYRELANQSVSAGTGLVYNHPAARFELNICAPIVARSTDKVRKGLQFGVGISFL